MKKLNIYVTEKLRINKDTKTRKLFDLDDWYLLIHKIIVRERLGATPELRIYIENILKIKSYDKEGNIIVEPKDWKKELKKSYEIINDRIILCDNLTSWDKCLLLPKNEAIDFLKNLKKNDYCIDLQEYFGEEKKKVIVRDDSMDHKITDDEIENRIDELENLYD